MPLGDPYATLTELKARVGLDPGDTSEDTRLTSALAAASRGVELWCHRQFNDAGTPVTPRVFVGTSGRLVRVDDFSTTTDLAVKTDQDRDGTFEIAWTIGTDFQVEPLDGIVDGLPGWPFWLVRGRSRSARFFPICGDDALVQVTARWGWVAVPEQVKQATLIGAEDLNKLKDAPFGVAGFGAFGAVRVRDNPRVREQLAGYRHQVVG